jgi:hypothetical protein
MGQPTELIPSCTEMKLDPTIFVYMALIMAAAILIPLASGLVAPAFNTSSIVRPSEYEAMKLSN